ncbi:MAG: FkbM family methyltransferase [Hyphomonadaceae bacterium]|nr:FkbM family methyltransferase [Hyphomonadaceae bacterium]
MSAPYARVLAHAITAAATPVERDKTLARAVELLDDAGRLTVSTRRGPLTFTTRRSVGAYKMARAWDDEPETLQWVDDHVKPGDVVWDIGAAIGVMAMYMALDPTVRVVAFEPKAASYALLVDHLAMNGMGDRVAAYCLALADGRRLSSFRIDTTQAGGASNGLDDTPNQFGAGRSALVQSALTISIDEFQTLYGAPAPDHLKLDVDGIEGVILRGAATTLPRVKTVMVEVEGDNLKHVAERIETPLFAAGFTEDMSVRGAGSDRNRLYVRA